MCYTAFLKTTMFIFNGAIFLAGVAMLGVAIWLEVGDGSLAELLGSIGGVPGGLARLSHVSYLLIGVGVALLAVGSLGCCGALRENRCMLMTFFVVLLIVFAAEVAAAVLVFVFRSEAADILKDLDEEIVENLQGSLSEGSLSALWYSTMNEFRCCGYRNYTDFGNATVYPPPCCGAALLGASECSRDVAERSNVEGCSENVLRAMKNNAVMVGAVAVAIAVVEVAAMVVSMVLYKDIGQKLQPLNE